MPRHFTAVPSPISLEMQPYEQDRNDIAAVRLFLPSHAVCFIQ